jgi:hypothetical protein
VSHGREVHLQTVRVAREQVADSLQHDYGADAGFGSELTGGYLHSSKKGNQRRCSCNFMRFLVSALRCPTRSSG